MEQYTKIRFDVRGIDYQFSKPLCQCCKKQRASDIHHIFGRVGQLLNNPFNLIALCRMCHNKIHSRNSYELRKELEQIVYNDLLARKKIENAKQYLSTD